MRIYLNKIYLIPNGVDLSRYNKIAVDSSAHQSKAFNIIYSGSINLVNDLKPIIKAAEIIQNQGYSQIKITLIGSGAERSRLTLMIQDFKLTNVAFQNPVTKNKLPAILQTADALLLLENKILYGSSNKLNDYLASGKPIIFSVYAKHNELSNIKCGITVPPKNPRTLAMAIVNLYQMTQDERHSMGRKGRLFVEKNRQIPVLADKLEKIL